MKKVAFRVDGGEGIGMGHLMRSLALASALPVDFEVFFITRENKKVLRYLADKSRKIGIIALNADLSQEREDEQVGAVLTARDIDILITDSYLIRQQDLLKWKDMVKKLVCIHDFAPFVFPADIVINGNIYAGQLDYRSLDQQTRFLLGTEYLLMREEFVGLPGRPVSKQVKNILITVGGADPLNLTVKILKSFKSLLNKTEKERDLNFLSKELRLNVVIGPSFINQIEILNLVEELAVETRLFFNINKMSKLMLESDLAISAGGSTLYELAAAGIPAITLLQAENQQPGAAELAKCGTLINLGPGKQVAEEKLQESLLYLITNYQARKIMAEKGQVLVDGLGARRCAAEIVKGV